MIKLDDSEERTRVAYEAFKGGLRRGAPIRRHRWPHRRVSDGDPTHRQPLSDWRNPGAGFGPPIA
jgi:hypothetical protein